MTPDELVQHAWRLGEKATEDTASPDPGAIDRAVDAYAAARAALPPGDPRVNAMVAWLGMLRGFRYTSFGGTAAERDEVIALLDELPDEPSRERHMISAYAVRATLRLMRSFPMVGRADFTLDEIIEDPDSDDDRMCEDVRRAEADLRLAAAGHGAMSQRLRDIVDGLRMCGDFLCGETVYADDPDPMLRLVDELLEGGQGPAPFRAELPVFAAWARCLQRLRDGEPATTAVADLLDAVGGLGEEHRLGAVLLGQVAGQVVNGSFTNDERVAASELSAEAWRRIAPFTDHPVWRDALRGKVGMDIADEAFSPGGDLDKTRGLIELLGDGGSDEPIELAYDQYIRLLSEHMHAIRDGRSGELVTALSRMQEALGRLDADHKLSPMFLNLLAGMVGDKWLVRGGLKNSEASTAYLGLARERLAASGESQDQNILSLRGQVAVMRVLNDEEGSDAAVDELATLAEGMTEQHFLWLSVQFGLGIGRMVRGARRRDAEEVRQGLRTFTEATESDVCPALIRTELLVAAGAGEVLLGALSDDDALIDGGLARLRAGAGPSFATGGEARRRYGLGVLLLGVHERRGGREYLDEGIAELRRANELIGDDPANPIRGDLLPPLAEALHERGDHPDAIEAGLAALRAFEEDVLLQTTAEHGLTMARRAAGFARDVAGWCVRERDLEGAVRAIEHGRGLLLGAATSAADAFDVLRGAGRPELADEWQRTQGGTREGGGLERVVLDMAPRIPGDLRYRVLAALAEAGRRPMPEPSPAEIAAALRRVGADALVYLLPANVRAVGTALLLRADGTLSEVELPDEAAVAAPHDEPELVDWAQAAVVRPLLDAVATAGTPRLVMVPLGALGMIPWHAARDPVRSRYACQDAVFSYIASGRQLIEVSGRARRPPDGDPVLVANPTGDLYWSDVEVKALGEAFYPFARVYGPLVPGAAGPGRPAELLAHLPGLDRPGASLLELACHARTGASPLESRLELAPGDGEPGPLELGRLLWRFAVRAPEAPGGLVVLSACGSDLTEADHDEALTLSTAFLAAGAATVVGTRWPVKDLRTAGLMFMFHHHLAAGRPPVDALRAAQLWMIDPGRAYPPEMPRGLREDLEAPDMRLEEVRAWAAFTHQGL